MFGSVTGDGTGQTIAIVDAYNAPTIVADLHAFDQQFFPGQADPTLTVVNQTGGSTLPGTDPAGPGAAKSWSVETSLDVEWRMPWPPAQHPAGGGQFRVYIRPSYRRGHRAGTGAGSPSSP